MGTVHLDGTTLEGGGQLLRVALSLSALYTIPIHVTKIRGKRGTKSTPNAVGGLKAAHLAAAKWLARATKAQTQGMEIGSAELLFEPTRKINETDLADADGPWKSVFKQGQLLRYESTIQMATPGATTLILQAILPYLLLLPSPVPLRLIIQGGTNVSKSPSIDYTSQVLLPLISSKLGLPSITTTVQKRGWSVGRTDVGRVTFDISPTTRTTAAPNTPSRLQSFDISSRDEIYRILATVISPDAEEHDRLHREILTQTSKIFPKGTQIDFVTDEISGHSQRCYLLLVAESRRSGHRLGRDWLDERKQLKGGSSSSKKHTHAAAERSRLLVSRVLTNLKKEVSRNMATDEFLEDQLVVFQAIANGRTLVNAGKAADATLHTQTARWVVERVLGIRFGESGECEGRGLEMVAAAAAAPVVTGAEGEGTSADLVEGVRKLLHI